MWYRKWGVAVSNDSKVWEVVQYPTGTHISLVTMFFLKKMKLKKHFFIVCALFCEDIQTDSLKFGSNQLILGTVKYQFSLSSIMKKLLRH